MREDLSIQTIRTSAEETLARFNTPEAAAKYARSLGGTATHHRELRCLRRALEGVPTGTSVLDLPCGTGRLLPALAALGFRVVEADSSPHMVDLARAYLKAQGVVHPQEAFVVTSVFETGFSDDTFGAVVCNRLFHHFRESSVRQRALAELRRIACGPIVASFFSSHTLDGVVFHLRQTLRRRLPTDRIPIRPTTFADDARAAGLRVIQWISPRPGISKQCYAVLVRG